MTSRLDAALQRFPAHEAGIRTLAARDPSGKLKYLDWGAKILASGQALAPELADILDLYHAFAGRRDLAIWTGHPVRIDPDIHRYAPKDIATLRDSLLRMKRARDKKQKTRERLYRIEGSVDAVAVYDSDDLIVRHIRNKQASCHYGRSTKWCIAMLRAGYFEDYATHNATFFFFERKVPLGDEFDKVALMLTRDIDGRAETFTATDRQTDMMGLARVYGMRVFAIFARIHEASAAYPGSPFARVYAGTGRAEDIEEVLRHVKTDRHFLDTEEMLESVACNDATPADVLLAVEKKAQALLGRRKWRRSRFRRAGGFEVLAALFIHPLLPAEAKERIGRALRRRHVPIDAIHRITHHGGRIGVSYEKAGRAWHGRMRRYRRHRLSTPLKLRKHAAVLKRTAARYVRRAKKLEVALAKKKAKAKPR